MNDLEASFAHLLGRQPTDADRQRLYQVKEALGLQNNDALWLVLIALQHYEALYTDIPEQIAGAAAQTLEEFRKAAESTAASAAESAKANLVNAISTASREVADHVAATKRYQWFTWTTLGCALVLCGALAFGYTNGADAGQRVGYAAGYQAAMDARAALAWTSTPEGEMAWRLARAGSIRSLASCNRPGWKLEDDICYPERATDGLYGWRVAPR